MTTVRLIEEHTGGSNRRWVAALGDGSRVECVLYRGDTLCVSSQVGCAVRCPFCASGARGLLRALSFEELVGQVEAVRALGIHVPRLTLSGVGEPLHNRAVQPFVAWCRAQRIAPSLTTSGGPLPRLREWLHAGHNGLTLSIHAGSQATRTRLVPGGPALDPLFATLAEELPRMTQRRRRKTALAYLLVAGENDTDPEIERFVERVRPFPFKVHLYAYNPVPTSGHRAVSRQRYQAIYDFMTAQGLHVRMSSKARTQPNGGCGTLVAQARLLAST